jgi:hypothetical protein
MMQHYRHCNCDSSNATAPAAESGPASGSPALTLNIHAQHAVVAKEVTPPPARVVAGAVLLLLVATRASLLVVVGVGEVAVPVTATKPTHRGRAALSTLPYILSNIGHCMHRCWHHQHAALLSRWTRGLTAPASEVVAVATCTMPKWNLS